MAVALETLADLHVEDLRDGRKESPPLVLVEWHDAWFDFDLPDVGERRADYLVRTVGFLVAEDPRFLSLAQEVLPEGEGFRAVTHIPVAIVERVQRLTPRGSEAAYTP
jgi:hypothetical protein